VRIVDQIELEKCESDVVYFCEKYLGYELLPWQKTYLRMYQKGNYVYFAGVRNGRTTIRSIFHKYDQMKG
jgi:hypothetical protein